MKKFILILATSVVFSCGSNEDTSCKCVSERWERYVNKNLNTQNIISATEWSVKSSTPSGTDCESNGLQTSQGSDSSYLLNPTTIAQREYKYITKCN